MKLIILTLLLVSCAQMPKSKKEDLVSLNAALNHAQASYLKGCVEAYVDLNIPAAFPRCRDKSLLHRREIDSIMEQEP